MIQKILTIAVIIFFLSPLYSYALEIKEAWVTQDFYGIVEGVTSRGFVICSKCDYIGHEWTERTTDEETTVKENVVEPFRLAIRVPSLLPPLEPSPSWKEYKEYKEYKDILFTVYFDFNSSFLNYIEKERLNKKLLELKGKTVDVIGYTDVAGTKKFNYQLSLKRAKRVAYILIANEIKVREVIGKGEHYNISSDKHCLNRRVEIKEARKGGIK